jgi:hypothetical protein
MTAVIRASARRYDRQSDLIDSLIEVSDLDVDPKETGFVALFFFVAIFFLLVQ